MEGGDDWKPHLVSDFKGKIFEHFNFPMMVLKWLLFYCGIVCRTKNKENFLTGLMWQWVKE